MRRWRGARRDGDISVGRGIYFATMFFGSLGVQRLSARFVCFIVRDSSYLDSLPLYRHLDLSYHSYRDCNIQNYVLAAEELAERGYYVIRMGAKVKEAFNVKHPNIIDYAFNGMRSDFMDIYLGAKCTFCVTVGTGFDSIPFIFRRPIVDTNFVPLGFFSTKTCNLAFPPSVAE